MIGDNYPLDDVLNELKWNEEGLIPAIVQNAHSKEVHMMAWMDRAALLETLTTHQVCFWSRSRQKRWRKGEISGHTQTLIEARIDCDADTLLLLVQQVGPACHTNRMSCFYGTLTDEKLTVMSEPEKSLK